jgi:hypothetical protein
MRRKLLLSCLFVLVSLAIGTWNAQAWVENVEKLAAAQPDECYSGFGMRVDPVSEDPFTCPDLGDPEHPDYAIPYTSQSYVWSLTQHENNLWFGTGANVVCTTTGAFYSEVNPSERGSAVCEYGESWVAEAFPNLPSVYGDWRPPKIYLYDLNTKQLIDRTPYGDGNINRTFGLRSAGSHNGVVFFAGGRMSGGIVMFAYNGDNGQYLGSRVFPQYRTVRKWLVVKDQLYTGVGTSYFGRILRWTGSVQNPWSFLEVGQVGGAIRELAEYIDGNGMSRIAVTAKGVFLSPAIVGPGLTFANFFGWSTIWSANEYEPDYTTRTTYVGGGIGFLNGWLYFGTMHIPGNATDLHQTCTIPPYDIELPPSICMGEPQNDEEQSALYSGTSRATSIWRIRNAESNNRVTQLLYGQAELPAYDPDTRSFPLVANVGGYEPLLGSSGFNSPYNNYAWVMEVVDNKLFIGTMDYSTIFDYAADSSGADLWRIDGTADDVPVPAIAETMNAFGSPDYPTYTNKPYGFRTLIKSADGTKLFAGMATGVNVGAVGDGAGWQLLQLDSVAPAPELTEQ